MSSGFSIREVTGLLTSETFGIFRRTLSEEDLENLLAWDLCVVHEFSSDLVLGKEELASEYLMRFVIAAMRWLQPTETTDTWFVQGFLSPQGAIKVPSFSAQSSTAITHRSLQHDANTYFSKTSKNEADLPIPECLREWLLSFPVSNASCAI